MENIYKMHVTLIGLWDDDEDTFFTGRVDIINQYNERLKNTYVVSTPVEELFDLREAFENGVEIHFIESLAESDRAEVIVAEENKIPDDAW